MTLAEQVAALDVEAMMFDSFASNATMEAAPVKVQLSELQAEIKRHKAQASLLREKAIALLKANGVDAVTCGGRCYEIAESRGAVHFDDEKKFSEANNRFVTVETIENRKVDKAALNKALHAGDEVPGAYLVRQKTLRVREL